MWNMLQGWEELVIIINSVGGFVFVFVHTYSMYTWYRLKKVGMKEEEEDLNEIQCVLLVRLDMGQANIIWQFSWIKCVYWSYIDVILYLNSCEKFCACPLKAANGDTCFQKFHSWAKTHSKHYRPTLRPAIQVGHNTSLFVYVSNFVFQIQGESLWCLCVSKQAFLHRFHMTRHD